MFGADRRGDLYDWQTLPRKGGIRRPGDLARFAALVAEEGANIYDIVHDRAFADDDLTRVAVHCIIETRKAESKQQLNCTPVSRQMASPRLFLIYSPVIYHHIAEVLQHLTGRSGSNEI